MMHWKSLCAGLLILSIAWAGVPGGGEFPLLLPHQSIAEDRVPPVLSVAAELPDPVRAGVLDVPGRGVLDVVATPVVNTVAEAWEVVDGRWVSVPTPLRYVLAFPADPSLAGEYYYGPADQSAVLSISDGDSRNLEYELEFRRQGNGWVVQETGTRPDRSSGGSGGEADTLDFTARCTLHADCWEPEALLDEQLEGGEDSTFNSGQRSLLTHRVAWAYSDDSWTSSTLSSVANAMEDRLWTQEANIDLNVGTYKMSTFPKSTESWDGTLEWEKFYKFLHDKVTVPTDYQGEFHTSPKLLQKMRDADRALSITYFTARSDGSTLGWGFVCSPGTWSDDFSTGDYKCRHSSVLPSAKDGYHRQSYDIGYTATHEMQHVLGMSTYSDPGRNSADPPHVGDSGGKKTENSCLKKVKWYEPLKGTQSGCHHSHFWWDDATEASTRLHLVRIQNGDPNASDVTDALA